MTEVRGSKQISYSQHTSTDTKASETSADLGHRREVDHETREVRIMLTSHRLSPGTAGKILHRLEQNPTSADLAAMKTWIVSEDLRLSTKGQYTYLTSGGTKHVWQQAKPEAGSGRNSPASSRSSAETGHGSEAGSVERATASLSTSTLEEVERHVI